MMTLDDAIEAIISEPKYYIGVMPQSTASNFVIRWRAGCVKRSTAESFISKFGYHLCREAEYKKVTN